MFKLKVFFLACCALLLSACAEPPIETPEQLIERYSEALFNQDASGAIDLFFILDEEMPADLKSIMQQGLAAKFQKQRNLHNGLQNIELGSVTYLANDSRATAEVIFNYPAQVREVEQWNLIKVENSWKVEI